MVGSGGGENWHIESSGGCWLKTNLGEKILLWVSPIGGG